MSVVSQKVVPYSRSAVPWRNASWEPTGIPAGTSTHPWNVSQFPWDSTDAPMIWNGATTCVRSVVDRIDGLALAVPAQLKVADPVAADAPLKYGPTVVPISSWAIVASKVAPTGKATEPAPSTVTTTASTRQYAAPAGAMLFSVISLVQVLAVSSRARPLLLPLSTVPAAS